jgi:hypothetical protein
MGLVLGALAGAAAGALESWARRTDRPRLERTVRRVVLVVLAWWAARTFLEFCLAVAGS